LVMGQIMWSLTNPAFFFFFLSFTQMDMPTSRTNDAVRCRSSRLPIQFSNQWPFNQN
jgi:hypothetical protein